MPDEDSLDFLSIETIPEEEIVEETEEEVIVEEENQESEGEEVDDTEESPEEDTEENDTEEEEDPEDAEEVSEKEIEEEEVETDEIDYKEAEKIFKPFKANGKEMQIDNADEAIKLMQMGANYNKKMQGIKPLMKIGKMLENNDLLDETKLNFLIELNNKNPDAIKQLIKESKIDPLDIDLEEENNYRPKDYSVSDNEAQLDIVINDIRDTPSFDSTIKTISEEWDAKSKNVLFENPSIITAINDQKESGIFDQIDSIVQKEKIMGRLNGMSDLEAYQYVGDLLDKQGAFNTSPKVSNEKTTNETVEQKSKKVADLKKRKQASRSTRSSPSKPSKKEFNPLSMSDEEFEKLDNKFI